MQRNHWTFLRCWHFGCYSLSGRSKPQRDCRVFVHCSASGENRRPARLRWKRWRSLDGSGSFYTWKRSDSVTHSDHSGDGHEWTRETQQSWTPCCCLFTYTHCSQHTHTPFHLLTRPFEPLPSGLLSIAVTKAATEWHFIPLLLVSLPPPLLGLRWGKINCKLPGWANRDTGKRWERLRNWNELEWKNGVGEWEDGEPQCSFDPCEGCCFVP